MTMDDREGRRCALTWNVGGRSKLSLYDLRHRQGARPPATSVQSEIVGGTTFAPDGRSLAVVASGAGAPADIWILDIASGWFRAAAAQPPRRHPACPATLSAPSSSAPARDGLPPHRLAVWRKAGAAR